MTGLLSVMIPLALAAFNLEEISVRTSLVGYMPGCQFPNLCGDNSCNAACVSRLLQEINLTKKAATPSKTGSPRTLWFDLNPDWQVKEKIAKSRSSETNSGMFFLIDVCVRDELPEAPAIIVTHNIGSIGNV